MIEQRYTFSTLLCLSQNIENKLFFSILRKLADYVNQTDFHGVSGHIKFNGSNRPGTINILQHFHNGTRLVGQFTPGLHGGKLQIDEKKIRWLTSHGKRPSDGHVGKQSSKY